MAYQNDMLCFLSSAEGSLIPRGLSPTPHPALCLCGFSVIATIQPPISWRFTGQSFMYTFHLLFCNFSPQKKSAGVPRVPLCDSSVADIIFADEDRCSGSCGLVAGTPTFGLKRVPRPASAGYASHDGGSAPNLTRIAWAFKPLILNRPRSQPEIVQA